MASERRSRSFVSHAATYAIANIARRVVGFAMLPIYTRFLTPADYGVIGLLTFGLSLFETLFGARLGSALPKFYFDAPDRRSRQTVIWGAMVFTASASVLTVAVIFALRGLGSEILFGNRRYALALGLFALTLLSQPIEGAGMTYIRLRERSRLFVGFSIAKLLLQLALNVLLVVYLREGVMGVVLSTVGASMLLSIGLLGYVAVHEAPAFDWQLTRRMVQFCWPLWLSGLAGLYIGASGAVYLRLFDTLSDVGRLELGLRFATVVGMLILGPFSQHWEPMSFQYYREANGKRKFQLAFIVVSALMFAGGVGVSIFSQPVIKVMAAKSFYAAAQVVPMLTLGFVLNGLKSFFTFSFMVTDQTKLHSLTQYATATVITATYLVLVPTLGLVGAAIAQCLSFSFSFVLVRALSRRYYDPEINIVPIGVFILIGFGAYMCSNVLMRVSNLGLDLLMKSCVLLIAVALIALVALREIRAMTGASFENLPWPLDRLQRIQVGRQ
jgi:O-antigen/teichoic acid export membrane protein